MQKCDRTEKTRKIKKKFWVMLLVCFLLGNAFGSIAAEATENVTDQQTETVEKTEKTKLERVNHQF